MGKSSVSQVTSQVKSCILGTVDNSSQVNLRIQLLDFDILIVYDVE